MSLTPTTPQQIRSFWERPEGTAGKIIVLAIAAAGLYGLFVALPFIIALLANTLYAVYLGVVIFAIGYVLLNSKFQTLVSYAFKSLMRKLTGMFIEIDPIGILKNIIADMKRNLAVMDEQIANVSGAIRSLTNTIETNVKDANHSLALAEQAKRMLQTPNLPPGKAQELNLQMQNHSSHAGRLMENNKSLDQLRTKLNVLYETLVRIRGTAEAYIEDKEFKVNEETSKRKAITSAFSAYKNALSILRGDPNRAEMYDQTMEYLAEDAGMKLGQMEDFGRIAAKFVGTMDLENGVVQQEALAQLEAFEKKMLPGAPVEQEYVEAAKMSTPDYIGLLRK